MTLLKSIRAKNTQVNNKKAVSRVLAKTVVIVLSVALVVQTGIVNAAISNEQIINSYTATKNGQAIITNLQYTDINSAGYDLKDAIYQNGSLGLFPSLGSRNFSPNTAVSKEMGLYLVYMAANRAQDIATQGESLNATRPAAQKKTSLQAILYDGSLQLAANDGLITQQELADALQKDQTTLDGTAFKRGSAVTRQEFATWLAKALMLPSTYDQQELFNSFSDWKSAKAENVPYIEAILQNNIMSGDNSGRFSPNQAVTRQQAARILKNAENVVLPLRNMEKRTATIEDLKTIKDTSKGIQLDYKTYYVRNSDGFLDTISVEEQYQKPTTTSNELTGSTQPTARTELPVYKDGKITNNKSLKIGDRIEYITGIDDKVVQYVRVLSNNGEISYEAAIVNNVNSVARTINTTPLKQKIEYPTQDISKPEKQTNLDGSTVYNVRSYSNSLLDAKTKALIDVAAIKPESIVVLGIKQNMIVELTPITVKKERETGLVAGIVEENNPSLGYITLYNEDGTGKTPLELSTLRTFNYADPNEVEVFKNHISAELDNIEAGDTVFVRIDNTGAVTSISSVPNYTVRYGKVIKKKLSTITVQTDKGVLVYNTDGADVIKGGKLSKLSQLKDGDRVKLLVNEAPNITFLKEILIEGGDKLVSNVYKGKFESYDDISGEILITDPWTLKKGQWIKDIAETFKVVKLDGSFTAYYGGKGYSESEMNTKKLPVLLKDSTVYIVSEKDYGNTENGVVASFVNEADKEVQYNDKVFNTSINKLFLEKAGTNISFDSGTIVVKDGRLVQGSSVTADDYAYIMANRDSETGSLVAGVISIEERPGAQAVQLYRGRISSIDEYKTVTVESYSKLNGVNWDYANTPMTFSLSSDTRITDTDGIIGQADFNSYNSTNTFKGRTIYILADGTKAVEISTAPYGNVNVSGQVIRTTGGTVGEDGTQLTQPSTVELINCKYYNPSTYSWVSIKDSSFTLLANSFIIKNNKRINPSEIKKGDKIRILKKDNTITGDAYIVIVEE